MNYNWRIGRSRGPNNIRALPERIGYVSKDLGARWATGRNVKGEDGPGTYKAVEVWALKVRGHNAEVVTIETHCTREQAEAWVWEGVRP